MDRIRLEDVRFWGHHGAGQAERDVGQWFAVDVDLAVDLGPAALSDDLAATVDYEAVARRIVEVGTGQRVSLIERLAALIADGLLRDFPADEARVRVRKLHAPLGGLTGSVSVELTRRRSCPGCS
jgi:dihydroneopterin aldolase